jgi:thiamine pyrophosphate-dependent acetolactate synthase large subunit-like protein
MTNEINSAVKFGARAVWVVLNDGRYGMCAQGMDTLGLSADAEIPQVDFAAFARAQGARAARVDHEVQLDAALADAMAADGPFVVDVRIDPRCKAPASLRNAALACPDPSTASGSPRAESSGRADASRRGDTPCLHRALTFPLL